jgi:malate dehydrogenase (oxaloacetate-decarboxylating)
VAAKALAACSPAKDDHEANLLPPLSQIRSVSLKVAVAVAKEALRSGHGHTENSDHLEEHIAKMMWNPEYVPYKKF